MESQSLVRKRKKHHKSRNGCWTCKKRRVKCDEAKPSCQRCRRTGWVCRWDEPNTSRARKVAHLQVPATLQLRLFNTRRECICFDFFRGQTVHELSGWFTSYFWQSLVLQMTHEDAVVRRAAIALGALHIEGAARRHPGGAFYALQYYGQSMSGLRHQLGRGKLMPDEADVCLTTCLLLTCFEVVRQEFQSAQMHYESGMKILQLCSNDSPEPETLRRQRQLPYYTRALVEHFALLEIQIISFFEWKPNNPSIGWVYGRISDIHIPDAFHTIQEAKGTFALLKSTALNRIMQETNAKSFPIHRVDLNDGLPTLPDITETNDDQPGPGDLGNLIMGVQQVLERWYQAFEALMVALPPTLDAEQQRMALVLRFLYIIFKIALVRNPVRGEMSYDDLLPEFEEALDQARAALSLRDTLEAERSSMFALGLGVIYPLFFIAVRCRHRTLRYRALDILSLAPHREGFWEATSATRVTRALVELEEQDRVPGTVGPEGIWPEMRVMGVNCGISHGHVAVIEVLRSFSKETLCIPLGDAEV
ncbi:hypothetical protein P168DRAFT_318002 [Aspergillus campestris IBT 28561]|uniref:Zn(2)-C6 fungal-type domain-containing protein n=1 Tax=Aspergillus campestris (strain IBT 28561) TaxID=1392248 RepID=A0A2I1D507_ASPC2|nr:uncharacterized protein P168DRAFT_318002 [Aspergillus campestris IBT 28561]PKY04962.1 hypothetical protein P168DRAFT_318002 [Aspergillus campestris IBT 28561]